VQISDMNDAQLASNRPNACSWPATGRMPAAAGERAGPTGLHVYSKPWQGGLGGGRGREELAERRELRRLVADVVREVAALRHDGQARAGHQAVQRAAGHVRHLRATSAVFPTTPRCHLSHPAHLRWEGSLQQAVPPQRRSARPCSTDRRPLDTRAPASAQAGALQPPSCIAHRSVSKASMEATVRERRRRTAASARAPAGRRCRARSAWQPPAAAAAATH